MADGVRCPTCKREFANEGALQQHLDAYPDHDTAATQDETFAATTAKAVPCLFPGCAAGFRTRRGLRIHRTLKGHQAPKDNFVRGDGPQPEPTVHVGPRNPPVEEPPVAT